MMRTVVISDLQCPYHDAKAVAAVAQFIEEWDPGAVLCVGDEADLPQISRWTQGTAGEYTKDLGKHRDATVRVLEQLQVTAISRSNHGDRLWNSISRRLPGLMGVPELEYGEFFRHDQLGITFHTKPYEFAPGWVLAHGDESGVSKNGGTTAINLAKKLGRSTVIGHTHRQGMVSETQMLSGTVTSTLTGVEVGHLIDTRSPGMAYTRGSANWQKGFAIVYHDGKKVTPVLVPIHGKSFTVEGETYSWN